MSSVPEASQLLRYIAAPQRVMVKVAIARAAKRLGWEYTRARDVFYAQAHRIEAGELNALHREAKALSFRFEAAARALDAADPIKNGTDIAALVYAARAICRLDLSRDD